jgi:hypothetical protein
MTASVPMSAPTRPRPIGKRAAITGPAWDTQSRARRSAAAREALTAYFTGFRTGMTAGPVTVPDLTGDPLACWLDGLAEGRAELDVDPSLFCPVCSGDGCPSCIHPEEKA